MYGHGSFVDCFVVVFLHILFFLVLLFYLYQVLFFFLICLPYAFVSLLFLFSLNLIRFVSCVRFISYCNSIKVTDQLFWRSFAYRHLIKIKTIQTKKDCWDNRNLLFTQIVMACMNLLSFFVFSFFYYFFASFFS